MPFTQGRQFPLRYCIDFMWKLHVHLHSRVLLSLSMLSPEKLLFSRRAVFASFVLPGRGRAKQLVVLILYDGRWRQWRRRSPVGRDCSFPLYISHPHSETGEFAAEANGQEMGSE